jgi:hypothetical protein
MNYGLELARSGQLETGIEHYRRAFDLMSAQAPALVIPETREMLLTQFALNSLRCAVSTRSSACSLLRWPSPAA